MEEGNTQEISPQGGLEVPCMLTFYGAESQLKKVQALVKKVAVFSVTKNPVTKADILCKMIKIEPQIILN